MSGVRVGGPDGPEHAYERDGSLAWPSAARDGWSTAGGTTPRDGEGGRIVLPGSQDLVVGADGRARCWWAAATPQLERYHDEEWGHGPRDERGLFERLSLEAFQAGLSWRIVLERRDALRSALDGFDPVTLATRGPDDDAHLATVLAAPGMIRNRAKVVAVLANARTLRTLHAEGSGLGVLTDAALRLHPPAATAPRARGEVPSSSPASEELARRLRDAGWRFVGPTTAHAYLQACGWVDDHLVGCHARGRASGGVRPR